MRNILGLYDGHNTNAALISDGVIMAAVEEERFSRIKNHDSRLPELTAPRESVLECLRHLKKGSLDAVAVALEEPEKLHHDAVNRFLGSVNKGANPRLNCREIDNAPLDFYDLVQYPLNFQRRRIAKIRNALNELGIDENIPFIHVNHHRAHAVSAYYTSGLDDALVITLDGKGDNVCGTVYQGKAGKLMLLHGIDYIHSLGHFYTAITVASGFKALRHEGKSPAWLHMAK